jgi:hypothetical protein
MKKILFILFLSAGTFSLSAQKSSYNNLLLVKYSNQELEKLQTENPEELKYLSYCIKNAFYFKEVEKYKIDANTSLFKEIDIADFPITNFFNTGINILDKDPQYFLVNGKKEVLFVKSKEQILNELKK